LGLRFRPKWIYYCNPPTQTARPSHKLSLLTKQPNTTHYQGHITKLRRSAGARKRAQPNRRSASARPAAKQGSEDGHNRRSAGARPAAKRGSEDGLCPPQRRGFGGSAPIKKENSMNYVHILATKLAEYTSLPFEELCQAIETPSDPK